MFLFFGFSQNITRRTMNPFLAKKTAADILTLKDKSAKRWASTALVLALLAAGLGAECMYLATKVKIIPYMIQVDKHGYAVNVGPVTPTVKVDERVIIARIAEFIISWRTVFNDNTAQAKLVSMVYSTLPDRSMSEKSISAWYQNFDPYKRVRENRTTVNVSINSIMKLSGQTWRVEWEEQDVVDGLPNNVTRWTGVVKIETSAPETLDAVIKNPLGVYITEISVSEKIN